MGSSALAQNEKPPQKNFSTCRQCERTNSWLQLGYGNILWERTGVQEPPKELPPVRAVSPLRSGLLPGSVHPQGPFVHSRGYMATPRSEAGAPAGSRTCRSLAPQSPQTISPQHIQNLSVLKAGDNHSSPITAAA